MFLTQEMEPVLDMVSTVAAEHRGGLEFCVCITPRDAKCSFPPLGKETINRGLKKASRHGIIVDLQVKQQ